MRLPIITFGCVASIAIVVLGCRQDAGTGNQANHTDTRTPMAPQIIDRMAEAYLNCSTYTDTGTVTTVFKGERDTNTVVKPFSTAMVRPNQFRFEFTEEGNLNSRYVVWRRGRDVRTWWDVTQKSKRVDSLSLALAGATGVSGSSAHTVPALLMPEVGGRMLTDLEQPTRGDDKSFRGHKCFTIEAQFASAPVTIWIDQSSFLIRRIDGTSEFDDFSTAESTAYDPVIDEDVAPKLLDYGAPE